MVGIAWNQPSEALTIILDIQSSFVDTLNALRIPRSINNLPEDNAIELHGFSDASSRTYAAAVYIRINKEKSWFIYWLLKLEWRQLNRSLSRD